jgi:hypothetical protein
MAAPFRRRGLVAPLQTADGSHYPPKRPCGGQEAFHRLQKVRDNAPNTPLAPLAIRRTRVPIVLTMLPPIPGLSDGILGRSAAARGAAPYRDTRVFRWR